MNGKRLLPLLVAVFVGLLSVAPQWISRQALGSAYRGVPFMFVDDDDYYLARVRKITEGDFLASSPAILEGRGQLPLILPIGEYFYALPVLVFRIPILTVFVAAKFLLPAVLFYLVYLLALRLAGESSKSAMFFAIGTSLTVTLGQTFVNPASAWSVISGATATAVSIPWTRLVNPVTGALFLFTFLLALWEIQNGSGKRRLWLPAGLLLALMSGYVFSWGLALAVLFCVTVTALVRRDVSLFKRLIFVFVTGTLLLVPYWGFVASSMSGSGGHELYGRNGMFFTHAPMFNKVLFAATVVLLILSAWQYRQFRDFKRVCFQPWLLFSFALIGGGWIAFNQQILTGRTIWPYHFVQYTVPFAILVVLVGLFHVVRPVFPKLWKALMALLALASLVYGGMAAKSTLAVLPVDRGLQSDALVFDWLNAQGVKDCVVYVREEDDRFTRLIPGFTSCHIYRSHWVFSGGLSMDRLEHNFFTYLRFSGVEPSEAKQYLLDHSDIVRVDFFDDWNRLFGHGTDEWVLAQIDRLVPLYADFYNQDFATELKKYRLDYLISDIALSQEQQKSMGIAAEAAKLDRWIVYVFK